MCEQKVNEDNYGEYAEMEWTCRKKGNNKVFKMAIAFVEQRSRFRKFRTNKLREFGVNMKMVMDGDKWRAKI